MRALATRASGAPADCDCTRGEVRLAAWRPTALTLAPTTVVTTAVAAPLTPALVTAAIVAGAAFVAVVALWGAKLVPSDVRKRVERERTSPVSDPDECASREHASVAVRVRRAVNRMGRSSVPSSDRAVPGGATSELGVALEDLSRALSLLSSRSGRVESLPAADVAELLTTLEDHLPRSLRLYAELRASGRPTTGPTGAAELLAEQVRVVTGEVSEANRLIEESRRVEERDVERDLAEHGRFLAERAARRGTTRPGAAAEPVEAARPLDIERY